MDKISKYGMQEGPYTYRRYLSINTEILGQGITNATGRSLAEYMEEKLCSFWVIRQWGFQSAQYNPQSGQ